MIILLIITIIITIIIVTIKCRNRCRTLTATNTKLSVTYNVPKPANITKKTPPQIPRGSYMRLGNGLFIT